MPGIEPKKLWDEALARYRAMVPLHPQPTLYLTVRHD